MSTAIWATIRQRSAEAHASGALYRIQSEPHYVDDGGVEFVVRKAIDWEGQIARMPRSRSGNPFLPPERELFVADVSPTHYALLNKYHVIENHLLVVTRAYVDQEVLLDLADFEALVTCLPLDIPAIGFYNGGRSSGASQPHKHLQVVTLPLSPRGDIPMSARLAPGVRALPFRHALVRTTTREPAGMLEAYRSLLDEVGLHGVMRDGVETQSRGYNFLIASDWMLLVPRSRDAFEGVAINSLAFAGALFVRHHAQMAKVVELRPMEILRRTTAD